MSYYVYIIYMILSKNFKCIFKNTINKSNFLPALTFEVREEFCLKIAVFFKSS